MYLEKIFSAIYNNSMHSLYRFY